MKYEIEYTINQEKALRKYKAFNKTKIKKFIFLTIFLIIIGLLMVLLSIGKPSESESFGFGITFGLVIILITVIYLYAFLSRNSALKKRLQMHYDNESLEKVKYELHDDRIIKKDKLSELSFSWEYFEKYELIENYVVLISKLEMTPIFTIDLNDIDKIKREEIIEFLKSK